MRLGLSVATIISALSSATVMAVVTAGCGGGAAEPATASTSSVGASGSGVSGARASGSGASGSGGENQQGRPVIATATAQPGSGSSAGASGPTQADVLGRQGYGGEGYGAGPGRGGGLSGLIGGDLEHPVPTCGARESYLYVARDFQCPGGGNPLSRAAADAATSPDQLESALLQAGASARHGNVGPHSHAPERDPMSDAHIVDLYEVPCPSGPMQVYVCLYHCPAGRSPIDG